MYNNCRMREVQFDVSNIVFQLKIDQARYLRAINDFLSIIPSANASRNCCWNQHDLIIGRLNWVTYVLRYRFWTST